jgi:8-oxo-dGTP diphosphatase
MSYTYKHPRPAVTADVAVFSIINGGLSVVLIKRAGDTFRGMWALPGGFLRENENLEAGARRELSEETGVSQDQLDGLPFIPFGTYGTPGRDPRGHVITVAFLTLVPSDRVHLVASTDAEKASWYLIDDLPSLAFDHATIIADAKKALAGLLSTDMS